MEPEAPLTLAERLAQAAGRGGVVDLTPLSGGRNNRVFRVATADGAPLLLKLYHSDRRDPRDRLGQEWAFVTYAWARGLRQIPKPLACDHEAHAGLYSFAPGRKLAADEVTAARVDQALDFVLAVNAPPRGFDALPLGSEACFALKDHIATIHGRVARLQGLDAGGPCGGEAERFVRERLTPAWVSAKASLTRGAARLGLSLNQQIAAKAVCLSPSDFGFHNALADGDALTFIDFEYAGRDDPAKLASDFFCQPDIPVPAALYDRFVDGLAAGLKLAPIDAERCRLLLDAYRVKWACILLNDFLPLGSARRAFAAQPCSEERRRRQIHRAERMLSQIASQP
jgi:hypothetical protein